MAPGILKKHETWINGHLLPNLFEHQKLIECKNPNQHIKIESVDMKPMSMENTYMLTFCYFVKISVEIKQEHVQCGDSKNWTDETEFHLVIKVRKIIIFLV